MQVSAVSSATAAAVAASTTADTSTQGTATAKAGNNDFMMMLLAQLTHQNPLEPMKDSEMMTQYASLNSVQELQNIRGMMTTISQGSQIGYAASLIGKVAKVNKADGSQMEGEVKSVTVESGKVMLQIGTEKAPIENVVEIKGA
jgi:flagellar basal-body rod modification protein FlgD